MADEQQPDAIEQEKLSKVAEEQQSEVVAEEKPEVSKDEEESKGQRSDRCLDPPIA